MIQDEVNPIRERIKKFSANNIWNADETAIFIAILSTEKETILKAWEKTNLKADFDFNRELENQDVEEEFHLQINSHAVGVRYCLRCRYGHCVAILGFFSPFFF